MKRPSHLSVNDVTTVLLLLLSGALGSLLMGHLAATIMLGGVIR